MKKRISIIAIVFTILLGGAFASTVSASTSDQGSQNYSYKVYYSINDFSGQFSGNDWLNNILSQFQNNQWNSKEANKEQAGTEKEESNKQETTPAKEVEKEEPTKVEQPAPEKETNQQEQPAPEQPKEEQPVEEEEAPAKEQVTEKEQENTETANSELSEFEQQVVELTNAERSKHGLQPLQADAELSQVAREKSRDMAANNYFAHNSPTYGSPFDMMQQFGVDYRTAGENIAKGQRSPQEVVNAWMNSEGHRANILNGNFTHIGVGYLEQGNHWTQMFIGK